MINTLSKALSILLHPLFIPIYAVIIIFNSGSYLNYYPYEGQKAIYIIVALSTIVLPLCLFVLFKFLKLIKTFEMHNRQERVLPYFITLGFYYFAYFVLKRAMAPAIIISLVLASIIALSTTLLISLKWKISAHMIGIGGLIGAIVAFSNRMLLDVTIIFIAAIFVAGLLGTARLFLQAHKPFEVYSGFMVGVIIISLTMFFL